MSRAVLERAQQRPELGGRIETFRSMFDAAGVRRIGLALDNHPDWIAADLAALADERVIVPLAPFFSPAQLQHVLDSADCQAVLTANDGADRPGWLPARFADDLRQAGRCLWLDPARTLRELPPGTFKISCTSGTTGQPKGICLSAAQLEQLALALLERTAAANIERHLCLLPLAVLLENVAGAWAAILGDMTLIIPSQHECGFSGSSGLDPSRWLECLQRHRPHSIIVLPQMLKLLHALVVDGRYDPSDLRMVAVGGARTPSGLIEAARQVGLPVHEGYGMTECGSVVCLNAPGQDRTGSVGRPLRHQRLHIDAGGQIVIDGPHHLGQIGDPAPPARPWPTGDRGSIDADGFVHVDGRIGNSYCTAWGRNVAPEWIEAELDAQPEIAQSFVHGRELLANVAILVPSGHGDPATAVARANAALPDYARIARWCLRRHAFGPADGSATSNGRLCRSRVLELHQDALIELIGALEAEPASTLNPPDRIPA